MTLGDAGDRFDAHDLVVRERGLQVDALRVEPKHPDRDRAGGIDEGRALEVIKQHAGRDVAGFGKIDRLRLERGEGEGEQDERAREHRDQPRTLTHRHAPILRNSLERYFPQLTVVASNDFASSTGS